MQTEAMLHTVLKF